MPTLDASTINSPAVPSPLDAPIPFTLFIDPYAKTKTERNQSLRQLADGISEPNVDADVPADADADTRKKIIDAAKVELPLLKLATFGSKISEKGAIRNNDNVLSISGVEGDYDGKKVSPETAVALLEDVDLAAVVYTTPSHTDAEPKWRVLCPLSRPHKPSEREALVARLNGALGGVLAGESFALSQGFFYGKINRNPVHRVLLTEG